MIKQLLIHTAEKASESIFIPDEVCNDVEYEKATVVNEVKSISSVDFFIH